MLPCVAVAHSKASIRFEIEKIIGIIEQVFSSTLIIKRPTKDRQDHLDKSPDIYHGLDSLEAG